MDLLNLLDHKRGTRICVNGRIYEIGADGVTKGVSNEDAAKLLQNVQVWKEYDPKKAAQLRARAKAAARGKMQLLDVEGNPVKPPPDTPGPPMDPMLETYQRPAVDGPPPVPQEPVPEENLEPAQPVPEQLTEDVADDPEEHPFTTTEDEWPDPDESMEIDYLRQMAEAYEVKFSTRTPKRALVKRISEAMYE